MFRIRRRYPRKMFGYPYAEVLVSHHENAAELARLRAAHPGLGHPPILTDKPEGWSWRTWGDYIDDTNHEVRALRAAAEDAPTTPSPTAVLADLLAVLEEIRDDLRAVRTAVEDSTTHEDLTALGDKFDKATDVLSDIRDDARDADPGRLVTTEGD